jgi:hypothetical protein
LKYGRYGVKNNRTTEHSYFQPSFLPVRNGILSFEEYYLIT